MHFSIPDTEEKKDSSGSAFVIYNLHVNGTFHCSMRYRQLHHLHVQLSKEFGGANLPLFPPKKVFPLNLSQVEERRVYLEKYILQLSQDHQIISSDIFNSWLVWAQKETSEITYFDDVSIEVYLMNGQKLCLRVSPTMQTSDLLQKVCKSLNLPNHLVAYFALFLLSKDGIAIIKKLQDFEAPYISQKYSLTPARITLRKAYWDQNDDSLVAKDKIGLNLIYMQTVSEVEHGWIIASSETLRQLTLLQARGAKMEYIHLAQTLKYYGYVQFSPCVCDFPEVKTSVHIAAGNKELNFRFVLNDGSIKEGNFKVTRMRCWRISSIRDSDEDEQSSFKGDLKKSKEVALELSFEYLMNKDEMRWIRVVSPQAVLMSLSLQAMVQRLLESKHVTSRGSNAKARKRSLSYMKRDGTITKILLNHSGDPNTSDASMSPLGELSFRRLTERLSEFSFKESNGRASVDSESGSPLSTSTVENNAFNIIGDELL